MFRHAMHFPSWNVKESSSAEAEPGKQSITQPALQIDRLATQKLYHQMVTVLEELLKVLCSPRTLLRPILPVDRVRICVRFTSCRSFRGSWPRESTRRGAAKRRKRLTYPWKAPCYATPGNKDLVGLFDRFIKASRKAAELH